MKNKRIPLVLILLFFNSLALFGPILGFGLFRIYEREIVRQTEAELNAQAAFVVAMFNENYKKNFLKKSPPKEYNEKVSKDFDPEPKWDPLRPTIDLVKDQVLPPGPLAEFKGDPDPKAKKIGEEINPVLYAVRNNLLAGLRVVDAKGVIVASTNGEIGQSILNREEIQTALNGNAISLLRERYSDSPTPAIDSISRGAHVRVFVALPIILNGKTIGAVLASRTPLNLSSSLHENKQNLVLFVVLTFLSLFALSLIGSFFLARSFRTMSAAIVKRSTFLKTYTTQVAHEIKTPLTAIIGSAEILLDHENTISPVERAKFLNSIAKESSYLHELSIQLLKLADQDLSQLNEKKQSLRAIVDQAKEKYPNLEITLTGPHHFFTVPEQVMIFVFSQLLENSLQHGKAKNIGISLKIESKHVVICFTDDGVGIENSFLEKIFEPKYSKSNINSNTGMGLTICRSLLRMYGGSIVAKKSEHGAKFLITLFNDKSND